MWFVLPAIIVLALVFAGEKIYINICVCVSNLYFFQKQIYQNANINKIAFNTEKGFSEKDILDILNGSDSDGIDSDRIDSDRIDSSDSDESDNIEYDTNIDDSDIDKHYVTEQSESSSDDSDNYLKFSKY